MTPGYWDVTACAHGFYIGIEVKSGEAELTPAQKRERERIVRAEGWYILVRTVDDLNPLLRWFREFDSAVAGPASLSRPRT